ncbi:MAG: hypothetical protein ACKOPO_01565 [Novosphingobium sp.]
MMTRHLAPALLLSLSACATASAGGDQWASFGERVKAGPVVVRPDRLVEDSRCPMNARCVWAGRVVIDATVWSNGRRSLVRLESDKPANLAGGTLSIDAIRPDSFMTNKRPARAAYRFHFRFDRPN